MRLSSIRGLVLEEVVLHLLKSIGYREVTPGEDDTRAGHSGLELRGRGEWHQIDGLVAFDRTPAFMYPLRLLVEAKCYARGRPVGIEIVRNSVGVLKDVSENYFTHKPRRAGATEVAAPRFNYHSAIFSTSGYTSGAQGYAIAHQVFLIQYENIGLLVPVVDGLRGLSEQHFSEAGEGDSSSFQAGLRNDVRLMLASSGDSEFQFVTSAGARYLRENVVAPLLKIHGSYFGMLQGRWPIHLVSKKPLPEAAFAGTDIVACRVYGRESDRWSFAPANYRENDPRWFRLEFDIPEQIVELVEEARKDPQQLAQVKQEQFSFLDLAGQIGGIFRQVRLRLDEEWLSAYLTRFSRHN